MDYHHPIPPALAKIDAFTRRVLQDQDAVFFVR